MDTISSRENSNIMPLIGVIAGVVGLALSAIALVQVSGAKKTLAAHDEKVAKLEQMESQVTTAASAADKANNDIRKLTSQTQDAVNQIGTMIGETNARVTKLEEATKAKAAPAGKAGAASKEPATAGPNEYIVKKGDTGMTIARTNKVSLADLQAVNPSVNWNKLKVGDKVKLPAKK